MKSVEDQRRRNEAEGTNDELEICFRRAGQANSSELECLMCLCVPVFTCMHAHMCAWLCGPVHVWVCMHPDPAHTVGKQKSRQAGSVLC